LVHNVKYNTLQDWVEDFFGGGTVVPTVGYQERHPAPAYGRRTGLPSKTDYPKTNILKTDTAIKTQYPLKLAKNLIL
jgi:hypothetical protein